MIFSAEKLAAGGNLPNKDSKEAEELDQVAGNVEDEIGERIAAIRETEFLYGPLSLLAIYGSMFVHVCGSPHKFKASCPTSCIVSVDSNASHIPYNCKHWKRHRTTQLKCQHRQLRKLVTKSLQQSFTCHLPAPQPLLYVTLNSSHPVPLSWSSC